MMKKKRTAVLLSLLIAAVLFLWAMGVQAVNDLGLSTAQQIGLGTTPLPDIVVNVVHVFLGLLGLLAVIFVLYGGFVWMTAGGNPDKISQAKKILINTVIGIVIILSSYALTEFLFRQFGWVTGLQNNVVNQSRDNSYYYSGGLAGGIIRAHYPQRGDVDVPRNVAIAITFKEAIDPTTIIGDDGKIIVDNVSISTLDGAALTDISVSTVDNLTFILRPDQWLGNDQAAVWYQVGLLSGIQKSNGDPAFGPLGNYSWQFATSTEADTTPPQVTSITPSADSTEPRNVAVQINFNEPVDPTSASGDSNNFSNIILSDMSDQIVSGTYTITNQYRTVEFLTNDLCGQNSCGDDVYCLPADELLNALIKAASVGVLPYDGVVDMAGNSLDGNANGQAEGSSTDDYGWNFNTTNDIDITAPQVKEVTPDTSANGISTRARVRADFNKPMLLSSINGDSMQIDQGVNYWINSTIQDNTTMSYINHDEFITQTTYHPRITNACRDIYQNCFNPPQGPNEWLISPTGDWAWIDGTTSGDIASDSLGTSLTLSAGNSSGAWVSAAMSADAPVAVMAVFAQDLLDNGSQTQIFVRSANTIANLNNATWMAVGYDGQLNLPAANYWQLKAELSSVADDSVPTIFQISLNIDKS
ncbi:MAG: Ig-like domain-containing protein [Candidatus Komeilibacteria bacterium]